MGKKFFIAIFGIIFLMIPLIDRADVVKISKPDSFRDCDDCSEMVIIPSGNFMMGASESELNGQKYANLKRQFETPVHEVRVKSFSIGRFDVTRAQFSVFSNETGFDGEGCTIYKNGRWKFDPDADWERPGFAQTDRDPVVCVSWDDAQSYIAWLNRKTGKASKRHYRLPTEEEWEFAARAGSSTPMYWGSSRQEQCKYANARDASARVLDPDADTVACDDGYVWTSPVGSFLPNAWGLYDMLGNAIQWVSNCMKIGYQIPSSSSENSPDVCRDRAQRGASWASAPIGVRSANRTGALHDSRSSTDGFRLAAGS